MTGGQGLKVLHIIDTFSMGGVETWLLELLRHFHASGGDHPQIDFVAASGNPGIFDDEVRALGSQIFYLRYGRSSLASFTSGLRRILKAGRYDAIHDHQGYVSGWHFLLGAGLLPPVRVTHVHNAADHIRSRSMGRRLIGWIGDGLVARFATHITGTSRQLITEYGFDLPRFRHIPKAALYCGFDPARFVGDHVAEKASVCGEFGWPADARIALFAGRMDQSADLDDPQNCKNSAFAVEVGIEAARQDPRSRLLMAGELSAAVPTLEARVAAAGLAQRIRFTGVRHDIARLMLGSDVLLFPSQGEGLGMVAVEAQAAGLPVLASTNVPPECVVVPDLVQFGDLERGPAAWAADLLDLASRRRDILAANAQVAASAFAIDQSARALVKLYRDGELSEPAQQNRMKKLRVLHVIDTFSMGGVETWIMELLRFWSRQGVDAPQVDFIAASGNRGLFDDEVRALGGRIFYLRYSRSDIRPFTAGFRRILKRGGYTAVHDHQWYTSGWHFLMGHGLLPAVRVTHVHNPALELRTLSPTRGFAARIGKGLVGRFSTHIAGTSRQIVTEYGFDTSGYDHIPKAALYCGFDAARFLGDPAAAKASLCDEFGWPPDSRIILFAGRIDQSPDLGHPRNHKNSGFAVSVAIECARRDPRVRMILAGAESPAVPVLQQRIADAGLVGRVQFAGVRRDIERLMLGSDVLLFPSQGEGLGMVAVEAQAAGLPVLASTGVPRECLVVPDLVRFREVATGVAAWADDVLELAARPRDLAGANRQVAASAFSIDYSAHALERLYREGALA